MTSKSPEYGLRVHLFLMAFAGYSVRLWQVHLRYRQNRSEHIRQGHTFFLFSASGSCADTAKRPSDVKPCLGGSQDIRSSWTAQDSATALQTTLSLISMTSPRNIQPQRAALTPSFVEFDMSVEGYGYEELSYIWKMTYW